MPLPQPQDVRYVGHQSLKQEVASLQLSGHLDYRSTGFALATRVSGDGGDEGRNVREQPDGFRQFDDIA